MLVRLKTVVGDEALIGSTEEAAKVVGNPRYKYIPTKPPDFSASA